MTQPAENPLWAFFDPRKRAGAAGRRADSFHFGEDAAGVELVNMINVAIAIGRPLLLTGPAGAGKSSIARAVAAVKGWELFETVVTSRSEADLLKAEVDEVQRLADSAVSRKDAQSLTPEMYLRPGVIWQALNPEDAKAHWGNRVGPAPDRLDRAMTEGRVLLIDEIDKGDIDFANDLLDVFDEGQVTLARLNVESPLYRPEALLIVITSNEEREFSEPFRRRCVAHTIDMPPVEAATKIGRAVLARIGADNLDDPTLQSLAEHAKKSSDKLHVSYFADLVKAASKLRAVTAEAKWPEVMRNISSVMRARTEQRR